MSGHSKWANIKHRKAAVDAKRGKVFTKLIRELTVAAKNGGEDLESNPRLRAAVTTAKNANMPNDTIDRAIKRGTTEVGGDDFHELMYEGYGPGGKRDVPRRCKRAPAGLYLRPPRETAGNRFSLAVTGFF